MKTTLTLRQKWIAHSIRSEANNKMSLTYICVHCEWNGDEWMEAYNSMEWNGRFTQMEINRLFPHFTLTLSIFPDKIILSVSSATTQMLSVTYTPMADEHARACSHAHP